MRPVDLDTAAHWDALAEHRFMMQRCDSCSRFRWQPRAICPWCHRSDFCWDDVDLRGTLRSWTVVHRAAQAFDGEVPYVVATVQLDEADELLIVGRLLDVPDEKLRAGLALQGVFVDGPDGTLVAWTS